MIDPFGRHITYVRLSVTDRCDLRCRYCMPERMQFLPKAEVLTIEEMELMSRAFVSLGVRKIRLTGGEPLVRRGLMTLVESLGEQQAVGGLDEVVMTTNGTQLAKHAADLARFGVRRLNVSVDTLNPDRFAFITRGGSLPAVLDGIAAAKAAGLAIKINTVALDGINDGEAERLAEWCGEEGFDLTFIEAMPLGETGHYNDYFLPLTRLRQVLEARWTLLPDDHRTGGPARYVRVAETGQRIGFITPMSHEFCGNCNRVRVTSTGQLFLCLGREDAIDLRPVIRSGGGVEAVAAAIDDAVRTKKPQGHIFHELRPRRTMSTTGG